MYCSCLFLIQSLEYLFGIVGTLATRHPALITGDGSLEGVCFRSSFMSRITSLNTSCSTMQTRVSCTVEMTNWVRCFKWRNSPSVTLCKFWVLFSTSSWPKQVCQWRKGSDMLKKKGKKSCIFVDLWLFFYPLSFIIHVWCHRSPLKERYLVVLRGYSSAVSYWHGVNVCVFKPALCVRVCVCVCE